MKTATKKNGRAAGHFAWSTLTDAELLKLRIRDLGVTIDGTWIEESIADLGEDLTRHALRFRPYFWLSSDWFVPDDVAGVAVPFYLAHPRLMQLERRQMLEAEGGTREEMLKILRHECGHAIDHAYGLSHDREWRELFGDPTRKYPEQYRPNPASRHFVQHLRLYYAQSHPVEDFAETFAVVVGSRSGGWKKRYAEWPALRKLEYVERLLEQLDRRPRRKLKRLKPDSVATLSMTLGEYYAEKRGRYVLSYPDIYDRDLRRLFSDAPEHEEHELASRFLRRNRAEIRRLVSRWTGEYQFTLEQVLKDMIGRSRELKLRAVGRERTLKMEFALLLTVKTLDYHYSRRNWFAL